MAVVVVVVLALGFLSWQLIQAQLWLLLRHTELCIVLKATLQHLNSLSNQTKLSPYRVAGGVMHI